MNLRSKFQTFVKGNLTMTDFLQQIHGLYCSLRAVVMNNTRSMPSFAFMRPMLLSEQDSITLLQPASNTPINMVLYSSAASPAPPYQCSNKGGSFSNNRGCPASNLGRY
ncbi:hypothetical protein LIER_38166 [Lithospermum erythrorhizon]|uniref:Uncharacterized protein n=1 Tax=Lithospermum erythrorhizon TaxID=34254 RepID=A0AAV3PVL3_LITER